MRCSCHSHVCVYCSASAGANFANPVLSLRADDDEAEEEAPQVLALSDLQREYAIARAHAVVAASMPSGEFTSSAPDDVFQHLLTLGAMRALIHRRGVAQLNVLCSWMSMDCSLNCRPA